MSLIVSSIIGKRLKFNKLQDLFGLFGQNNPRLCDLRDPVGTCRIAKLYFKQNK